MRCVLALMLASCCLISCKRDTSHTSTPIKTSEVPPQFEPMWKDTSMTDPLSEDDPRLEQTSTYFVTASSTSLCPSVEGALARECGHSIEFGGTSGYGVGRGDTVTVVQGNHDPEAEVLPVIRYMVQGLTPGYVARADVSPRPMLPYRDVKLEELEPRIVATIDARTATQKELRAALEAPTSNGFILVTHVKPTEMTSGWEKSRPERQHIGFELALQGARDPITATFIVDVESFMFPGFMSELDYPDPPHKYRCDKSYCDVIDLVFTKKAGSPASLFYVIDRFGVHDLLTPDQWAPAE